MKKPSVRPARPEIVDLAENPESFRLRREWFAEDRPGFDTPKRAAEIGAMIVALRHPPPELDRDPGGGRISSHALIGGAAFRATLAAGAPDSGFASPVIDIRGSPASRLAALKLTIDPATVAALDPETIRVFRYQTRLNAWRVVGASGFNLGHGYAWCVGVRAGRYAAMGLPRSMPRQALIRASFELRRPATTVNIPELLKAPRLAAPPKTALPRAAFAVAYRKRLASVTLAGLPEWDLLRELAIRATRTRALSGGRPSGGARVLRSWESSGPENFSGRLRSVGIDPARPRRMAVGAANGGVWVTGNSGLSWRPTMEDGTSLAIGSCAIAGSDTDVIYAGTGESGLDVITSYTGIGIFKSTDFGGSWTLCPGSPAGRCQRIVIDPLDASIVYAAMDSGLYKTADGGNTWANIYPGERITDAVIHPTQTGVLIIGAHNAGVFRTRDGGATWEAVQNEAADGDDLPTGADAGWISLSLARYQPSLRARFAVKMGKLGEQVFVSQGAGRLKKLAEVDTTENSTWRNVVALDIHREDTLFAGSVDLYRIEDGNWSRVSGTHADHHEMAFHPSNKNRVWVATDGGLYRSTDAGRNWSKASPGLTATQFYSLDVSQAGPFLMVGSTQDEGILRSRGTATWEDTRAGNEGGFVAIDPTDSRHVFVRPWSTGLRRSDDLGQSWTTLEQGLRVRYRGIDSKPAYIRGFAVKPNNGKVLVAAGTLSVTRGEEEKEIFHKGAIFRSVNRGGTWARRTFTSGDGRCVAFAPSNSAVCYVGTSNGRVFRSGDAGKTWALRQRGTRLLTSESVNGIAVDTDDARIVYACLGGYGDIKVMRSADAGKHWIDLSGAGSGKVLPAVPANSIVQNPAHPDVLFVATDIGIFRSGDAGDSWYSFNEGYGAQDLPRVVVTKLVIQRDLGLLFASTIGRGVWHIRL